MSDIVPEVPAEAPAEAPPEAVAVAPEAVETDPFDAGAEQFPRSYVEKLRQEAATRREAAKALEEQFSPWKQATEGWDDEQQQLARELLVAVNKGDQEAINRILFGEQAPEPAPADEDNAPLTRAEYKAMREAEARDAAAAQERAAQEQAVAQIVSEAKGLGYNPDAAKGTPEHKAYADLVYLATYKTDNDLKKAHEALKAAEQEAIDKFLAAKASASTTATPANMNGSPSGERPAPTSWDDMRAAVRQRFEAAQQQVG